MNKTRKAVEVFFTETLVPFFGKLPRHFLVEWLEFTIARLYTGILRARYYRDVITTQRIGNKEFKLLVKGGHMDAQKTYLELEKAKDAYEPIMLESLKVLLSKVPNPVFMDIGSFMGYYACSVSRYLEDKTAVYALESNPEYCKYIRRSSALNSFIKLKVFNAVLSDKEEVLSVFKETVTPDNPLGERISTVTLDMLCEKENIRPNILKIDVHGAEGKVIFGAKSMLKEHVSFILMEIHPDDYLREYSGSINRKQILSALEEAGFKNYLIGGFRYQRSPEREIFNSTGKVSYIPINDNNKELIFFDRHVDLFVLSAKGYDISSLGIFVDKS